MYMVLQYIGKPSIKLLRKVSREIPQHKVEIRPAYRTTKVGSYFSLKIEVPALFKKDVVYEFVCPCDRDARYIGETRRQFFLKSWGAMLVGR